MNILIIEDIEFRQELIKSKLENLNFNQVDCANTAEKATQLLKENKYDIVFFDHDLVGHKTGSHITKQWFEEKENYQTKRPIIFIHSMNIAGADVMENYLKAFCKSVDRIPFKFIATEQTDLEKKVKERLEN
jgi:CheY-like chemotaxis protein